MPSRSRWTALGALCLAFLVAGCSGKAAEGTGGAGDDGVKTGPGVTAKTIRLGAMSDLSGAVFGPLGRTQVQGNQLYIDKINKAGGICGRRLELVVKDHGYDVQKATVAFSELEPQVLGITHLLGSPITAALEPEITTKKLLTVPSSFASSLLKSEYLAVLGTTYDIDMINGLAHLVSKGKLAKGDTVSHIYFEGEYGTNALKGSTWAAGRLGLTLRGVQIKATDADLTAQVTRLKSDGAKAILLSASARQTASVAGVTRSIGLDVPIVTQTPGFDPALLDTPVRAALEKNLTVLTSYAPYGADAPGPKEVAALFKAKHPNEPPNALVDYGYVSAQVIGEALKQACTDKDLTREGLGTAYRKLKSLDTGGLMAPMDFTVRGAPASTQTFISRVDGSAEGGLVAETGLYRAQITPEYKVG
ncbi:ABC transporter substrate-binding protein [Actinomadura spongiicola]|uniref:ABC transporter substrate-binding protein n=1 Tax=Actinomadura spongiicola TaxID=2303421 RepID=A0A372G9C1_9ACTN|nr:ABC transporter substrate-binding protein [Actinomadura spongiicola]RFS81986.1 ABC transporter substrate-binding protein [Actinomadura spongiicola]